MKAAHIYTNGMLYVGSAYDIVTKEKVRKLEYFAARRNEGVILEDETMKKVLIMPDALKSAVIWFE